MSKGINKDSMSRLLEGLTSVRTTVAEERQPAHTAANTSAKEKSVSTSEAKPASKSGSKERICTSIDTVVMNKIRAISEKEGVLINELITLGLDMLITKYEDSHGQIRPKKANKGDITSIFR